jgi:hypothetical protein
MTQGQPLSRKARGRQGDVHEAIHSRYYNNPLPPLHGLTGVFGGDMSIQDIRAYEPQLHSGLRCAEQILARADGAAAPGALRAS